MNTNRSSAALSLLFAPALLFLTSCGGETDAGNPDSNPTFAKTKTTSKGGSEDASGEERPNREKGDKGKGRGFADRDSDGDGVLSREELGDMGWLMVGRADEDGDGSVSEAEMQTFRESGGFRPPEPAEVISALDKDGDGRIGADEMPDRMRERLGEADLDGDGKVSLDEIETRREQRELERALNGDEGGPGRRPGGPRPPGAPGGGRPSRPDGSPNSGTTPGF